MLIYNKELDGTPNIPPPMVVCDSRLAFLLYEDVDFSNCGRVPDWRTNLPANAVCIPQQVQEVSADIYSREQ